ncbi:MAG: hypothetical protein GY859_34230 [Desulfobacterales bacterium]|nr:hypothetical protein [Desulfobacterales bacterium]
METIAFYWEPIIKTYGLQEKTGLSLHRISLPADRTKHWGPRIREIGAAGVEFQMALGQVVNGETLQLDLLFEEKPDGPRRHMLKTLAENEPRASFRIDAPVHLIYFHGPHFGDRHGIAHAALGALMEKNIPILSASCAGAGVNIVVPQKRARAARKILSENFITPGADKKSS